MNIVINTIIVMPIVVAIIKSVEGVTAVVVI